MGTISHKHDYMKKYNVMTQYQLNIINLPGGEKFADSSIFSSLQAAVIVFNNSSSLIATNSLDAMPGGFLLMVLNNTLQNI